MAYYVGHERGSFDAYFREMNWDSRYHFADVPRSILSLVQIITSENWNGDLVRHLLAVQPATGACCFILVGVSVLGGFSSIMSGVTCALVLSDSMRDLEVQRGRTEEEDKRVMNILKRFFTQADEDGSGTLSFEEMEKAMLQPEIAELLAMVSFRVETAQHIFNLLDYDESGELDIDEFLTGCLRARGEANSKDLYTAQLAIDCMKGHVNKFEDKIMELNAKMLNLSVTADALTVQGERAFLTASELRGMYPDLGGSASMLLPSLSMAELESAPWNHRRALA